MTFEEKWNHVARRLFVFFTREGVFNFSQENIAGRRGRRPLRRKANITAIAI